ncbi:MAG: hypothetical protein JNK25_13040 [Phycisphaerae bacterium]|nr:hypothetical protein [Phycisphaerae bacterium]
MNRRASILIAVLVALVLTALTGLSVSAMADGQRAATGTAMERTRLRSLAWSGAMVVLERVQQQRTQLLQGGRPDVPEVLLEVESGGLILTSKLLPLDEDGTLLAAENARLDARHAPREVLLKIEGLGDSDADRIISLRAAGPKALENAFLRGELSPQRRSLNPASETEVVRSRDTGFADWFTFLNFEPAVQRGSGTQQPGIARVVYPRTISEELREALRERLGDTAVAAMIAMESAKKVPSTRAELFAGLSNAGETTDNIAAALDLFRFSTDPYEAGLVNVNEAPARVLMCLPGIDASRAEGIVSARSASDVSVRMHPTWLLTSGCLTPAQFRAVVPYVTTRSLQWRVRIGVHAARLDEVNPSVDSSSVGTSIILEVIIDASGTRARIASIRDITYEGVPLLPPQVIDKVINEPDDVPVEPPAGFPNAPMKSEPKARVVPSPARGQRQPPDTPPRRSPAPPRDVRTGRWRAS